MQGQTNLRAGKYNESNQYFRDMCEVLESSTDGKEGQNPASGWIIKDILYQDCVVLCYRCLAAKSPRVCVVLFVQNLSHFLYNFIEVNII